VTPYYQDAAATLFHADARDVLPSLGIVDLLITDPPYGVQWSSGWRAESFGDMAGDGTTDVAYEVLTMALPHLRTKRHLYVFGPFTFDGLPVGGTTELVWDKTYIGPGDLTLPWGSQHERILFGVRIPAKSDRDDGRGNLSARLRRGSVLRHARPSAGGVRHPSEKPVGLLRELIESSSVIGELVLDPFVGIGSTLVAARLEDRRSIGIEVEERWCEVAAKRLAAVTTGSEAA
jgi:DNA modification methylase